MKKLILTLFLCSVTCQAQILLDAKLGVFAIQDTKGEKTYLGFPEIGFSVGTMYKNNIYLGLEFDNFALPNNYNLWGTQVDDKLFALKNFISIGWLLNKEQGQKLIVAGYDPGLSLIPSLIPMLNANYLSCPMWQLKYVVCTQYIGNTYWTYEIGVQQNPTIRLFGSIGLRFQTNKKDKNE